jgi:hypothetical protein
VDQYGLFYRKIKIMPVTINGTTGIVTPALVNGTALSFRNKIINGNFGINQRGYVSGTATSGANQYTLDRWRVVTSGQNLTFSASGTGNIVTAPAGGIEQVIESLNIEGGTYTLSWTGTATGAVNGSAVSNGGQVTLTANTNATIKFSSGTVSLVQLEAGSVATPFENRPIGTELALCQRYYEVQGFAANALTVAGTNYGTGAGNLTYYASLAFAVVKRATPTVSISGTWTDANTNGTVTNSGTSKSNYVLQVVNGGASGNVYSTTTTTSGITAAIEL